MNSSPRILYLEDNPDDVVLVAHLLKKAGLKPLVRHTDTKLEFITALQDFNPDIIISDHALGPFDSLQALQLAKKIRPGIPFISVSGMACGELSFQLFQEGAASYILKDHLQQLPPAIVKAMEGAKEKKQAAQLMLQVQEKERNEIGRELHDNINQLLAAASLYVQSGLQQLNTDNEFLRKGHNYITRAISEIRTMSHKLATPVMGEIKLTGAIEELIHDVRETTSLDIFFVTGNYTTGIIEEECKVMLYRILQEHMNNIIRHAAATKVNIELSSTERHVVLTVSDDGKGFDMNKERTGIGLKNIQSRAELLQGHVKIISSPGRGCLLIVSIPLKMNE